MKKAALLPLIFLLAACGAQLRPDPGEVATLSNYPTAEFYACGQHFVGLGTCTLRRGESLASVGLAIMGYYKGNMRVFSEDAPIDSPFSYDGTAAYEIPLNGRPTRSLILGFSVNPEYPGEQDQAIILHGTRGYLSVVVAEEGEDWTHFQSRVPEQNTAVLTLNTSQIARILIDSRCPLDVNEIEVTEDFTRIRTRDIGSDFGMSRCTYFLFLIDEDANLIRSISWNVIKYAQDFAPLPAPSVRLDGNNLIVRGHVGATVVALDGRWLIDHKGEFDNFDRNKPHVLRLLTVKGRVAIGDYVPGEGWTWKR